MRVFLKTEKNMIVLSLSLIHIFANWFMNRYSITKTMIWYCVLGTIVLLLTCSIHSPLAIWGAVATSFFFGPVYPTVYAHGLDQIEEKQHTETGGALMVRCV